MTTYSPQRPYIVCCDFDGVLCEDRYPLIGPPRRMYIEVLDALEGMGAYIIINSARRSLDFDDVHAFLTHHHVAYQQIVLGAKPVADCYIDDKMVGGLPDAATLLMLIEAQAQQQDVTTYYTQMVQGQLTSPFAVDLGRVPEAGPVDEGDPRFRVIIPVTGGMDSLTLYQMAQESGLPLTLCYIDMGQTYATLELRAIADLIPDPVEVFTLPLPFEQHAHILRGRNAVILHHLATTFATRGYWGEIWFGALAGESPQRGGDKSRRFLNDVQRLIAHTDFRIVTPLIGLDKVDEVRYWRDRGELDRLKRTKSCFSPTLRQCGRCQSCFRKFVAFVAAGERTDDIFPDGTDFAPFVRKYEQVLRAAAAHQDFRHYSPARIASTLRVITTLDPEAPDDEAAP